MENSKHTPGPWNTNANIGKKSELGIIAAGAPCIICTMSNAKEWPVEARANARLIAAAPELLEAAQSAMYELIKWQDYSLEDQDLPPIIDALRDVISKINEP